MYFDTNLSVVIDGFQITTIVKVDIHNDAQKVGASCDIIVPLNSYIKYSNPVTLKVFLSEIRSNSFPQGTSVVINAKYVGLPNREIFRGYVYDFILGMPLTIKCLDYIYFWNLGIFGDKQVHTTNKAGTKIKNQGTGVNYKSIQFQDLLQQLITFVNGNIAAGASGALPCELMLPIFDMELQNLTFINMSPAAILEWFKKELGLNITFYSNKLYVNIASKTVGSINLSTGVNVIKSELQTNLAAFQQIRLKAWFIRENGTRDSLEVGNPNGYQVENFFYKVKQDAKLYDTLANAALLKAKQHHFKGNLEILLYPACDLFYIVNYSDLRYPEKNGQYYIIGITISISQQGFHQYLKVAWLNIPEYGYLNSGIISTQ